LLRPDGRLFILGLNRSGMRYLSGRTKAALPGIRPLVLRGYLEKLDMKVLGLLGAGFGRTEWPRRMNRGLSRMLIPLADLFLIEAGPSEAEIIKPLAKSRLRALGSPFSVAGR